MSPQKTNQQHKLSRRLSDCGDPSPLSIKLPHHLTHQHQINNGAQIINQPYPYNNPQSQPASSNLTQRSAFLCPQKKPTNNTRSAEGFRTAAILRRFQSTQRTKTNPRAQIPPNGPKTHKNKA
ncbi:hypothetical protein [Persicirhabdus sediminis]|uniref:hypothetical protein n=1 Tax=Persicirhabdus sediminis TaxID=454144 RepID=UPI001F401C88|nr:hypothetical protein [Persicirhabdus sediminis]